MVMFFRIITIFYLSLTGQIAFAAPLPSAVWDWQLSEAIVVPENIKVFGADPDNVTNKQILALNAQGIYTICYVSVGTLENWRSDVNMFYDKNIFKRSVVGKRYGDWPDEFFLDIRNPNLLFIMQKRFLDCALKGFQAIEPDNMDVYQNASGFDITATQSINYIKQLISAAHAVNLEIGQKNVPELTDQLVGMMDFVITESCFQDNWCEDVLPYIAAGKPVFDAEYDDREIDFKAACAFAKKHKISMILKDRELTKQYKACPQ